MRPHRQTSQNVLAWVHCSRCDQWFHCCCVGLQKSVAKKMKEFLCPSFEV